MTWAIVKVFLMISLGFVGVGMFIALCEVSIQTVVEGVEHLYFYFRDRKLK